MFKCEYVVDGVVITPNPDDKVKKLLAQIEELQNRAAAEEKAVSEILSRKALAQKELDALVAEARDRQDRRSKIDQELAELAARKADIDKKLAEGNSGWSAWNADNLAKRAQLEREKAEIEKQIKDANERKTKLEGETAQLNNGIVLLKQDKQNAELILANFKASSAQQQTVLTKAIKDLQAAEVAAKVSADDFSKKAAASKAQSDALANQVQVITAQIKNLNTQSGGLTNEVNTLTANKNKLNADINSLTSQFNTLNAKKLELDRLVLLKNSELADIASKVNAAAASASSSTASGFKDLFKGLASGDRRATRESLAGLGSLLSEEAKLTFDGKVIGGQGWLDAFRNEVRKPYNVPVPEGIDYRGALSDAYNVTGTGIAGDVFASRDQKVGAKVSINGIGYMHYNPRPLAGIGRYKSTGVRGLQGLAGVDMNLIQGPYECCTVGQNCGWGDYSGLDGRRKAKVEGVQKHFRRVFGREPNDKEIQYYGAMFWCAAPWDPDETNLSAKMVAIRNQFLSYKQRWDAGQRGFPLAFYTMEYTPVGDYFPGGQAAYEESFKQRGGIVDAILNSPTFQNFTSQIQTAAEKKAKEIVENATKPPPGTGPGAGTDKLPQDYTKLGEDQGLSVGAWVGIGAAALLVIGGGAYFLMKK